MTVLLSAFPSGASCRVVLGDGTDLRGVVVDADAQWLLFDRDGGGRLALNRDRILWVCAVDEQLVAAPPSPSRTKGTAARGKAGGRPGRPWSDEDLRALADGFLDNQPVAELATRFARTRGVIKELRMAFECARGNLVEEDLSPVAQTWVGRWSAVLTQR